MANFPAASGEHGPEITSAYWNESVAYITFDLTLYTFKPVPL